MLANTGAFALLADGGVLESFATNSTYIGSDGSEQVIDFNDFKDASVVRYGDAGAVTWGGVVRTSTFFAGRASVCSVDGTHAALVAAFHGSASVDIGPTQVPVASQNANTTFLVAKFDAEHDVSVLTPFVFNYEAAPTSGSVVDSPDLFCDSNGFTIVLSSTRQVIEGIDSSGATVGGDLGTGVARFSWDGTPQWALNLKGLLVTAVADRWGRVVVSGFSPVGENANVATVGGGILANLDGPSKVVMQIDVDGSLDWVSPLSDADYGYVGAVGIQGTGHLSVSFGGWFSGGSLDWSSVSPAYAWTGDSDINAFAGLLNSAAELSCSGAPCGRAVSLCFAGPAGFLAPTGVGYRTRRSGGSCLLDRWRRT